MPQVTAFPLKDASGVAINGVGRFAKTNVTAAAVIKTGPGRVARISIIAPGSTSGAFTINDAASLGAAAASNELWSMAYNAAANVGGAVITIDLPFVNGLVVSAVPGGGSPQIVVGYD